ncbi:hypothetical protein ACJMK2_014895 [Sinanodonta woodiana]|uniref:Uncharacterized protein n=1 Tax=Sinanodonta woodiana TaxID=1069815 RepID=A0ABD3V3X8_SINWO
MPIKVYVWLPHGDNVGHSSMTLSDGTHISWWPSDKEAKKKSNLKSIYSSPASLSQNLDEDIYLEGNFQPNENYSLPDGFIDEDAISKWWGSFSSKENYRVLDQNCCHVVFKALEAGNAWNFIKDEDVKSLGKKLLTPSEIDRLLKKLKLSIDLADKPGL